jgi:hypothetical protein
MAPPTATSVQLYTREYFDYLNPDPSVITLDVIARGLDVPRFNNQTTRPITVREHSLRVDRIARVLGATGPWPLLHDAHEALVPWGDCLRPGKTQEMRDVESAVDAAIIHALGLDYAPFVYEHAAIVETSDVDGYEAVQVCNFGTVGGDLEIVKTADAIALYFEAMLWLPGGGDWAPSVWPDAVEMDTDAFLPLIAPRPGECWRNEVESRLGKR